MSECHTSFGIINFFNDLLFLVNVCNIYHPNYTYNISSDCMLYNVSSFIFIFYGWGQHYKKMYLFAKTLINLQCCHA